MRKKETFDQAIVVHSNWKKHLKKAIETGTSDVTLAETKDVHQCLLGQWLDSQEGKYLPHYTELLKMHEAFHEEAAAILQLVLLGEKTEAAERITLGSRFGQLSAQLINKLVEIRDSLP